MKSRYVDPFSPDIPVSDPARFSGRRTQVELVVDSLYQLKHGKPLDTVRLHRLSTQWLTKELSKPFHGKTVVVTHFAPHRSCVATKHDNSALSPYFVTDLSRLMATYSIDVWCHGHTHTNNDFVAENGCRVISNQRGYPGEVSQSGFRPDLIFGVSGKSCGFRALT